MSRLLPVIFAVLLLVLIAAGTVRSDRLLPATSPQGAVQSLFDRVKARNYDAAYSYVAPASNVDQQVFQRDLSGRDGSLRTYSSLAEVNTKVLKEDPNEALVRTHLTWSTAVGPLHSTRDLKVVKHEGNWKVLWPAEKRETPPPQVIPVNYLRWDIIRRGAEDEWGSQNVEAPRVRIVSMNAVERDGNTIVMGEIVNEDTVPAFVVVSATLLDENNSELAQESSFDKIQHTLLPKEVSPYRIDFPGVEIDRVKNVRMQPNALLVPASADPVIAVLNQRIEKDTNGRPVLRGELLNQSGITVNIPHVLATYYDDSGSVVWVADGYVDDALLPQTPVPFAVDLREELAKNVQSYRVSVNHYTTVSQ